MTSSRTLLALLVVLIALPALAFERQDVTFKVFQFPASMAPRIDGNNLELTTWNAINFLKIILDYLAQMVSPIPISS